MDATHYIVNNTKKEYLKCPDRCETSISGYAFERDNCMAKLLISQLALEWKGDNISIIHKSYLPWNKNDNESKQWKDITLHAIKEFNYGIKIKSQIRCLHDHYISSLDLNSLSFISINWNKFPTIETKLPEDDIEHAYIVLNDDGLIRLGYYIKELNSFNTESKQLEFKDILMWADATNNLKMDAVTQ